MSMDAWEKRLSERQAAPASKDFERRICAAAGLRQQYVPVSVWLRGLFADFAMPRPGYAFASILLLGVVMGLGIPTVHDAAAESLYNDEAGAML